MGIISMFPVFSKVESSTGHSADKLRCPFRQEREGLISYFTPCISGGRGQR